jgi:hypothetical protein
MFFSKESLVLVLCRPSLVALVLGIVLIVWGEIGGGVCLDRSQLNQNLLPTIDFQTYVALENTGEGVAGRSVGTNFTEWPYKKLMAITRAYPLRVGVVTLDPS